MADLPPPAAGDVPIPPPYELLIGDQIVPAGISDDNSIRQLLHWIGFRTDAQKNALVEDAFESFTDMKMLSEKDIATMSSGFASRTAGAGRIIFGTRKTKLLKAAIHWVQDFYRISATPSVVGLSENTFKAELDTALARASIRDNMSKNTSTNSDAANPGALKSEKEWKQWEEKFVNYTSSFIGANGVPLSYVIRDNDVPDNPNDEYPDFITKTVACAPLRGEFYTADRLTVFKLIVSFTTGQSSHDWVKDTVRYSDGRRSMKALRAHFAGEGNASRNISDADRLKEQLHYKTERAMAFETFLTQCKKMFNIYDTEGEPMAEDAKIRFLFKRIHHEKLKASVEALRAQITAGVNITYTMAANHLSTAVSEFPEYIAKNRSIAGVSKTGDDDGEDGSASIYNADGTINTGYIPNYRSLSQSDRDKVDAERKRLGISRPSGKKGKGSGGRGGGSSMSPGDSNRLKQLSKQNRKYKRTIKSLKRSKATNDDSSDDNNDDDDDTDAADQFGGRAAKRNSKQKKKSKRS